MNTRVLVLMVAVMGSVACGSSMESPTGVIPDVPLASPPQAPAPAALTPSAMAGTWTLFTVDGAPLPAVIRGQGDIKIELLSDALTLRADGTSTESATTRFTAGPRVETDTTVEHGSFTINGAAIDFAGPNGRRSATMNGGLLVVSVEGMTWVFRRS